MNPEAFHSHGWKYIVQRHHWYSIWINKQIILPMRRSANSVYIREVAIVSTNVLNWMPVLRVIYGVMVSNNNSNNFFVIIIHNTHVTTEIFMFNTCSINTFTGYPNCPSGFDESSSECGATRKLLELPASLYAALGCLAAGIAACLIFCLVGISRRRKKTKEPKQHPAQTVIPNGTYTLPKSNGNTYQKNSLFYNHDHDSWHMLPPVDYVDYIHVDRETTGR